MVSYCTVTDIRNFSNVSTQEFSDTAVQQMIDRATQFIDMRTGRTWQGTNTVTNEYYDGDDTDLLWLNQSDIKSITALAIDQSGDNVTYTTVTVTYANCYPEGYIVLNRSLAEVNLFKAGSKTVRISYTNGAANTTTINILGGIDASTATITVSNTDGFPIGGTILIESERIDYTGKTATTFTGCTRGAHGTTAATHATALAVTEVANEIQNLCILLVRNYMYQDSKRSAEIEVMISRLKRKASYIT